MGNQQLNLVKHFNTKWKRNEMRKQNKMRNTQNKEMTKTQNKMKNID